MLLLFGSGIHAYQRVYSSELISIYSTTHQSASIHKLASMLEERIGKLQMDIGIYPRQTAEFFLISTEAEYQKISKGKAEIVEFSDAFYSAREERIYARGAEAVHQNYLKILLHEYIHWYLDQLFIDAPLWFHEGMATYHGNQLSYDSYLIYIRESFLGDKGNLYRMSYQYPASREDWPQFYYSSAMALRFMQNKHPKAWQDFWEIVAESHKQDHKIRFNQAFTNSYGLSLWDFHQAYERYSKRQSYLYLVIGINSLIFLSMPVIMLLVARKRRKRMLMLPDIEESGEEPILPVQEGEPGDKDPN